MIFVIIGKSATGKDSIFNEIKKKCFTLQEIVPYTTRQMRNGETNGKEYNFVSEMEYREIKKKGLIVEERFYNTVNGLWRYFTVDEITIPAVNYIMIGTIDSFHSIKKYYSNRIEVIPIYIWLDDHERLLRAIRREEQQSNPNYLELCRRYLADDKDFTQDKVESLFEKSDIYVSYKNERPIEESVDFIFKILGNKLKERSESEISRLLELEANSL